MNVPLSFVEDLEMDSKPSIENEIFQHPPLLNKKSYLEPYKEALSKFKQEANKPVEVKFAQSNLVTRKALNIQYNIL